MMILNPQFLVLAMIMIKNVGLKKFGRIGYIRRVVKPIIPSVRLNNQHPENGKEGYVTSTISSNKSIQEIQCFHSHSKGHRKIMLLVLMCGAF